MIDDENGDGFGRNGCCGDGLSNADGRGFGDGEHYGSAAGGGYGDGVCGDGEGSGDGGYYEGGGRGTGSYLVSHIVRSAAGGPITNMLSWRWL